MSWAVGTRAHVSKVKVTSDSRPRSSRPRILRSLVGFVFPRVLMFPETKKKTGSDFPAFCHVVL